MVRLFHIAHGRDLQIFDLLPEKKGTTVCVVREEVGEGDRL